jgi:chromosome condensin MukBEF complex kleisin-like MukF subunit
VSSREQELEGEPRMDDEPWAVRKAEDYLELYQIREELLRVLPDEVIDWLKREHPEEELERVRELMAALPPEDLDAFTDALIALELHLKRHGYNVIRDVSRSLWLRGLL